ncbi:calcium-dependent phosphotriesterase [Cryphonectria parasitica EP155]|uniref:Calcium-dependent phosphotriesterase n=1 Tax=Cryphonectria parasitica (strain ATCC 38755 / EP155) TaxID=660469 RepID=A0A9P5CQ86_CRYP1|nr:calcium-dependent phosphotriesterase [Cryphonectria parasitica EP155]KAF3766187.1 calcium-dependent phosphotriesterase [Cryphonectria parasitica EP155]
MAWMISLPTLAVLAAVNVQWLLNPKAVTANAQQTLPAQAQVIDQRSFNVWPTAVPPSTVANGTQTFMPPGISAADLSAKPFHVYDEDFLSVIGQNPTLTLIAEQATDPLFHEAVVWYEPTDEVFFAQNAGAAAAGTGLNKSSIIQKISLAQVDALKNLTNATGQVTVTVVPSNPMVINPNGAGASNTSEVILMNPREPYNTTVLLNNYFGRQFNSLNDAVVHPISKDLYFTDTLYGYLQDFRPPPGLRNQVYRWNDSTGAVTVVADDFVLPNGITISPDGKYGYVTDTGINEGFWGYNFSNPASIYRFDIQSDGTWDNRKIFAFVDSGVPDGVHVDSVGNVYAGCGDGVHVWNPSGKLLGKIYLGDTSANFQFAGDGRLVICAETKLFYVTLAASGDYSAGQM